MSDNPLVVVLRAIAASAKEYSNLAGDQNAKVGDAGRRVVEAVRELLAAFTSDDPSRLPTSELREVRLLMENPSGLVQYESLAMLAAVTRYCAATTGRTEEEVLEELAKNYEQGPRLADPGDQGLLPEAFSSRG